METAKNEFLKEVSKRFERYCDAEEKKASPEEFLQFLLDRNFIENKIIKRFVVVNSYPKALNENLGIKKTAIWQLEEKYNIPEPTIKTYLQRHQQDFRPKVG